MYHTTSQEVFQNIFIFYSLPLQSKRHSISLHLTKALGRLRAHLNRSSPRYSILGIYVFSFLFLFSLRFPFRLLPFFLFLLYLYLYRSNNKSFVFFAQLPVSLRCPTKFVKAIVETHSVTIAFFN